MKKCLCLFTVSILLLTGLNAQRMDPVLKFSNKYYRSNPFTTTFGTFLEHVMNDPDLKNVKKQLRTDTSLFVFNGTYTNYNPFDFKPSRVDVALVEQNVQLYVDRPEGDTIMLFVLIAFADSTAKGAEELKKEYSKIQRRSDRWFLDRKEEDITEANVTGMSSNYFVDYAQVSPVSVEWVLGLTKVPILRLTMRIRSRGNEAVIPASLYDSSVPSDRSQ
ncbi:MAG: hypothetical protein EOO05_13500 [Chitinophagaceae bacterium]|nr:MAG: hypothetical protein EOO05_13500 [Chitinophagaceae bacterium]